MLDERQIMLKQVELVASQLLAGAKSRTLTLKLRTLVRYAYTSYVKGTLEFPTIRAQRTGASRLTGWCRSYSTAGRARAG
ncbi:hypothetical protein [Infirmifilum sp. NZ]|uniref:hypothetical protein n=1 Tax=Infirmifilum sp. NZ TaxID=2926850 RepID=UPI0027A39D40|nr:hypothetical protein [Infirmifilum sp. NZ]UNQ73830.1 hypothetical protein MOV14_02160 [Infirmifilum sp. NZ]